MRKYFRKPLGFFVAMILLLTTLNVYGEAKTYEIPHVFQQEDSEWKDYIYDGVATIGKYGCLITSIAMVESYYQNRSINPKEIVSELNMTFDGYGNLKTAANYAAINVSSNKAALEVLYEKLQNGPVILGGVGASTHYMVVNGYTGDCEEPYDSKDFTMIDNSPWWSGTINTVYSFTEVDRYYNNGANNDKWPTLIQVWYRTSDTPKLTIAAGTGGTVNTNVSGSYEAGNTIALTATANAGYVFSHWTSSNGGTFKDETNDYTTFTMPANDTTVTAHFKLRSITEWEEWKATATRGPDANISGRVIFASDRVPVEVGCYLGTSLSDVNNAYRGNVANVLVAQKTDESAFGFT